MADRYTTYQVLALSCHWIRNSIDLEEDGRLKKTELYCQDHQRGHGHFDICLHVIFDCPANRRLGKQLHPLDPCY